MNRFKVEAERVVRLLEADVTFRENPESLDLSQFDMTIDA